MDEMIAFCGLDCARCPAFLATKEDNDQKRVEVARQWSKLYRTEISTQEINCDGCRSHEGRLFSHCHVCEIRACAREGGLSNCGQCNDYPCGRLDFVFASSPEAKKRLDAVVSPCNLGDSSE